MAYDKQTWDTNSFVNPTRMNHIENGIEANSNSIDELTQGAAGMSEEIGDIKQNIVDNYTKCKCEAIDLENIPIKKSWGGVYISDNLSIPVSIDVGSAINVQVTYNCRNRGSAMFIVDGVSNGHIDGLLVRGTSSTGITGRLFVTAFYE